MYTVYTTQGICIFLALSTELVIFFLSNDIYYRKPVESMTLSEFYIQLLFKWFSVLLCVYIAHGVRVQQRSMSLVQ